MNVKLLYLAVLMILTCPALQAQERTLSGRVIDADTQTPLPGVSVMVKGTNYGTSTDSEGAFTLAGLSENDVLLISYIGYLSQEVSLAGQTDVTIVMQTDSKALDEVVVVGYGTVRKSDLTGSLSSVDAKDLISSPSINPVQALSGRAPGVRVMQNSGQPGSNISIRVRGGNSLNGNNEPLYVVDGFPLTGAPTMLNTADIESINILKDASATAIYGSRGANGVVMITTKSGQEGQSKISVQSYYGMQKVLNTIDMLDARQFAEIANLRADNDGVNPFFSEEEVASLGKGIDWQNEIFSTAPIQSHTLTFSGGDNNTRYSLSGSLFDQQGIISPTAYQRISVRSNFSQDFGEKLNLTFSSILSQMKENGANVDNGSRGSSILSAALLAPPTLSPYDQNGDYTDLSQYAFSPGAARNAVALMNEQLDENNVRSILANAALTYEIIKNLDFKVSIGLESVDSKRDRYSSTLIRYTPTGSAQTDFFRRTNVLNENVLTYGLDLDERHALNFMGGFTYQSNQQSSNGSSATGFANNTLLNNSLQSGDTPGIPTSSISEWTMLSWLGRINYVLDEKYLFTASFRADGSSRFGKENKWGYFPSLAFAWRLTEESFIQDLNAFSDLKLRLSWGRTGSTAINPYQTLNTISTGLTIFDNDFYVASAPGSRLPNSSLKWETTQTYNIGLDFSFANNRFRVTVDGYDKKTTDLLAVINLPPSIGYTNTLQNIGSIRNQGLEIGFNADILTNAFQWSSSLNVSHNKNKVLALVQDDDLFGANLPNPINTSVSLTRMGQPVGVFYGYLENGLDEEGKIQYKDISGPDGQPDGLITNDDKTIIGNPYPKLVFGFNNEFAYKNFSLNIFLQGVYGNDIWNNNLADYANSFNIGINQIAGVYGNYWMPESPGALYPKISTSSLFRESDRFIEDGSYLRLKNVRLNYNIPTDRLNINGLSALQIYISAQNLATLTNYSWYDPDVNTRGGGASISPGIDQTGYPSAKTYTLGILLEL